MNLSPANVAAHLPRNRAKVGDTIRFRDALTTLEQTAMVESVSTSRDHVNKVYGVYGNRMIHSRYVLAVS